MSRLVIVITAPNLAIADLNGKCEFAGKMNESVQGCISVLEGVLAGTVTVPTVQITTRDTAPSISTSGSGSTQNTFSK